MKECYNYFVRDYKVGVKRNNNFDVPNTIERVEKRSSHLRTATAIKAEEGKGREERGQTVVDGAESREVAFEGKERQRAWCVFDVQKVITGWFPVIISRAH